VPRAIDLSRRGRDQTVEQWCDILAARHLRIGRLETSATFSLAHEIAR
jgi:hypothetical protein